MKRLTLVFLFQFFLIVFLTGSVPAEEEKSGDRPPAAGHTGLGEQGKGLVARVNGAGITVNALVKVMNRIIARKGNADKVEGAVTARKEALDRLIVQELAYQKAKSLGLTAGDKEISDAIDKLREKAGGEEGYKKALEHEQMSEEEARAQVERSLLVQRVITTDVLERVAVSEAALREEYKKREGEFTITEKVVVSDVFFFLDPADGDSLKKAEAVLGRIREDKDTDPMKLVSDGSFIVRNVTVGRDKQGSLYEAAKKLAQGELSGVLSMPDGLHIVKLVQYTPEKHLSFEDVKDFLEQQLKSRARQERLREWEAELKKDAKIEILEVPE